MVQTQQPAGPMKTYHFAEIGHCKMCGAPAADAKVVGLRMDRRQGRRPRARTGIAVTVCRCRSCGLHSANPEPRPNALSDHYGVPPESYWKAHYFAPDPGYFGAQIAKARDLLGNREGLAALDIGVGIGKAARALGEAGFDTWGIEPSEPFRARALELTGLAPDRIRLAPVEEAEFAPASFDLITFGAVLEHLYEPSRAIARALTWLRPGGVIHIEVPSSDHLVQKIVNLYYRLRGTGFVTNLSPMHEPFHICEFTLESFRRDGARSGYEVAAHHFDVATIYHLPKVLHPPLRWWMAKTDTGMQLTVWLRATG